MPIENFTERPEDTVRRFAGQLVRLEQMIDTEIARLEADDLKASWWERRRKHWVEGVGVARAVSVQNLWEIKSAFYESPAAPQEPSE